MCVTYDHEYVLFIVITINPFTILLNWFVTRVIRGVSLLEPAMLTLRYHINSILWCLCCLFLRILRSVYRSLFVIFLSAVSFQFTASDYPFGIFIIFVSVKIVLYYCFDLIVKRFDCKITGRK